MECRGKSGGGTRSGAQGRKRWGCVRGLPGGALPQAAGRACGYAYASRCSRFGCLPSGRCVVRLLHESARRGVRGSRRIDMRRRGGPQRGDPAPTPYPAVRKGRPRHRERPFVIAGSAGRAWGREARPPGTSLAIRRAAAWPCGAASWPGPAWRRRPGT